MFMYVFSIVLIVASNVIYNICQKSTPTRVDPFSALFVTYITAAAVTLLLFFFNKNQRIFRPESSIDQLSLNYNCYLELVIYSLPGDEN